MGRLVRVGSYYIPLLQLPSAVRGKKSNGLFCLSLTTQLWGKWRPYTLSVFAIANTRDGRGV